MFAIIIAVGVSASWTLANFDNEFNKTADCAVVFGAAVWADGRPSHALADRTVAAVELYKNDQVNCLIMSGADREPSVMAKIAHNLGVDDTDITQDAVGLNTLATLKNIDKDRSYVLVSNDFHLGRIRMIAARLGLDAEVHAAEYRYGRYTKEIYFTIREIAATMWYAIRPLDIWRPPGYTAGGGEVAQRLEQGAHNASVVGSTPTFPTTHFHSKLS